MNTNKLYDFAALAARLGIGVVLIAHGVQKLFLKGPDATATGFEKMGIPAPTLAAWFAGLVEFGGGIALVLGLFAPIAGVLILLNLLGATYFAHISKGLFVSEGGFEFALTLGLGALAVGVAPGVYALDRLRSKEKTREPAAVSVS